MQSISETVLTQLTQELAHVLSQRNWLLTCAESCTGGWLAKSCTDLSGSSNWFDRGFVTYSNQAKQDMLDVSSTTLEEFGAVSQQTVIEMAHGALQNSNANISVAITGIAGPNGGSKTKPVGTVWFAWAMASTTIKSECCQFDGDRNSVRLQAAIYAIKGIIKNARA